MVNSEREVVPDTFTRLFTNGKRIAPQDIRTGYAKMATSTSYFRLPNLCGIERGVDMGLTSFGKS